MFITPHTRNIRITLAQKLRALKSQSLFVLTSALATLLCCSTSTHAVESVILKYRSTQIVISIADLKAVARGDEVSRDVQQFFQQISLSPETARHLLTYSIKPSKRFKLDRTTTEFLVIQLNRLVGNPYNREPSTALRAVMASTINDSSNLSILKLIEANSEPVVQVELSLLEQIQKDISRLSKQIQPVSEVVSELMNYSGCNCEPTPIGPAKILRQADSPQRRVLAKKLNTRLNSQVFNHSSRQTSTILPTYLYPTAQSKTPILSQSLYASKKPTLSQANHALTSSSQRQQLILTYGPFQESLLIHELSAFAEIGELSHSLKTSLKLAKVNPKTLRTLLTREITVNPRILDKGLNSILGEYALFQVGQIIHTRAHQANIQALRAALIQSASNDNRISLIEFLQNYPLQNVYVDGVKLSRLIHDVKRTGGVNGFVTEKIRWLKNFLVLQGSVPGNKCGCQQAK